MTKLLFLEGSVGGGIWFPTGREVTPIYKDYKNRYHISCFCGESNRYQNVVLTQNIPAVIAIDSNYILLKLWNLSYIIFQKP